MHSGYLPFLAPQERFEGFSCVSFSNGEFSRHTPYSGGYYDFEPQRLRELHSKNQQRCHDAMEWLDSKKDPILQRRTDWNKQFLQKFLAEDFTPQSWMPKHPPWKRMGFWVGSIRRILLRWYFFFRGKQWTLPGCKGERLFLGVFGIFFETEHHMGTTTPRIDIAIIAPSKIMKKSCVLKISLSFWEGPCSEACWLVVKQYFFCH